MRLSGILDSLEQRNRQAIDPKERGLEIVQALPEHVMPVAGGKVMLLLDNFVATAMAQ
ncbi:hypothetical protein [Burkholderia cepacia]|uniref:hypothetical protein n=1 Tax=Burkholderia cepacia TaxID=292 RepID=UPI000B0A074B|nr:hypothetical protein [Burkholderia cepacia]